MKKLPIGVSNFKELVEGGFYYVDKTLLVVDKTLLVSDILEGDKVSIITRPRRNGKTLNLSLIKYFFEQTEESNKHLFEDTKISELAEYQKLQGAFPVISLAFKDCYAET